MEQDHNRENGVKDGNGNTTHKLGPNNNPKPQVGRAGGSIGPSLAMKIPGKQPPKSAQNAKKGRTTKNGNFLGKEGQNTGLTVMQNLPNGGPQQLQSSNQKTRDGRRPQKEEKPVKRNTLPITQASKSRSQNSSRNNSVSPVNQTSEKTPEENEAPEKIEDATADDPPDTVTAKETADVEEATQGLKQLLSIGTPSRIIYSRIQLLNLSENASSKQRPECLEADFNATNGRWDPENWHRSLSSPPPSAGEKVRKFSFSDNRERYQDDSSQGGIVLGPQRRSFQDGCHVTNSASRLSKLHAGSPTEPPGRHTRPRLVLRQRSESVNDFDGPSPINRDRQIESASALRTDEFDWERDTRRSEGRFRERDLSDLRSDRGRGHRELPRDLHELRSEYARESRDNRDGEYRDRDFRERKFSHQSSRDFGSSSWYQSSSRNEPRQRRYSNNEPEPEWYTEGPTSQFDTIELGGFKDDTPADFSSWGGEIPMDDVESGNKEKQKEEKSGEKSESEKGEKEENLAEEKAEEDHSKDDQETQDAAKTEDNSQKEETSKPEGSQLVEEVKLTDLDFNDLLGIPGLSSVMEQILKENGPLPGAKEEASSEDQPQGGNGGQQSSSSRFSQWFQREQVENLKKEAAGSRNSTPHEELENLAELAAERGLASPVDLEAKHQAPIKNDILRLLTQNKAGNISPNTKAEIISLEQHELARRLLMQQVKSGGVMSVAELEAKAGARQSPQSGFGGVDVHNTEAFNRLVASIREKDKIRQRQQILVQQQQAALQMNQMMPIGPDGKRGTPPLDMKLPRMLSSQSSLDHPGARIPSPEELRVHTQNVFQQALIKKQLEKQKEAYREKIRQIEQQRREEQLREAIRSADAKLQESKQMNKSLAFMPTSVMRKMQESREGKMQDAEMFSLQQQQMMGEGTHADALASATASFSAKLANSGKKMQQNRSGELMNPPQGGSSNDLLARIYQSASQTKSQQQNMGHGDNPGLRRNASFPDVLLEANKLTRASAFHQPTRQNIAANSLDLSKLSNESESARLRNLLAMSSEMQNANLVNKQLNKPGSGLKQQPGAPGGSLAADYYNNNLLKAEAQSQSLKSAVEQQRKPSSEPDMSELKNQHEVALLTQAVLNKFGINEDQLSRLTPQQQQIVVSIVQEQYYQLQLQKRLAEKKVPKDPNIAPKLKQGDLPPPNAAKHDLQLNKNGGKPDQNDARMAPQGVPQSSAMKDQSSGTGVKFTQQQINAMPGVAASIPGLLQQSNPHMTLSHPLQIRPLVPPPMAAQFLPPPMARGMIPTTFLPSPQTHLPGRLMPPPPPNVPLASPLGPQYQAAALMQMQFYQQQQRALLTAAAIQQQQQQMAQQQAYAAARQHHQSMKQNARAGNSSEFTNPLERWFGREVLSQSQLPTPHHRQSMTASDIERVNSTNQKQE